MGKSVLYKVYLGDLASPTVRSLQAQALGIADRNVGKVSGRTEFYQRLKALSVVPTKGQAVIVGVPSMTASNPSLIFAIKSLRELTLLGLKESKDAILGVNDSVPYHFPLTDIETANRQAKAMREAGCTVQVNLS